MFASFNNNTAELLMMTGHHAMYIYLIIHYHDLQQEKPVGDYKRDQEKQN